MEHGTVSYNTQAPSVAKSNQSVPASKAKGRVVICPDYLGYGASVAKIHPYMNQELTAINSIDMELAVLKYFADWEPKHPINFYHSTTDDTVPIENYYELMKENKKGGASLLFFV